MNLGFCVLAARDSARSASYGSENVNRWFQEFPYSNGMSAVSTDG